MIRATATIVSHSDNGLRVCASSGRISTQAGSALEIFERAQGDQKDLKLVGKVLSSGHKSLIEHQSYSIAFDNVSVLTEQFMIEFRLGSFTVKSRRYVNFAEAGFVEPKGIPEALRADYCAQQESLFADYDRLLELGVPKEDARFVLPYCFRSNFYMTLNARELVNVIGSMVYGRGQTYPEIYALGRQLECQLEAAYPGVLDSEKARYARCLPETHAAEIAQPTRQSPCVEMIGHTENAAQVLTAAIRFSGRFASDAAADDGQMRKLLRDARPRELEAISATFRVKHVSLACVTHFVRHRMLSVLVRGALTAVYNAGYMVPESVQQRPEAMAIYVAAFERANRAARAAAMAGLPETLLAYYALSGNVTDIMLTMNAREMLHFMKLRTCSRAQWEIRGVAWQMLNQLRAAEPVLYAHFGPSCAVDGKCPEGRLSCGKPHNTEEKGTDEK